MYIDKNKGFSLLEIIVTMTVTLIILQTLYLYLNKINEMRKESLYRLRFNREVKLILDKIDRALYESLDYKIYNMGDIRGYIDYSISSLESGNTLVVEKYIPLEENYTEIEIYQCRDNSLYSFLGKRKRLNEIGIDNGSRERILKNVRGNFNLEEYGVSLEGYYLDEKLRKEFKK